MIERRGIARIPAADAQAITRAAARAAVATGPDNRILHWNGAATELLGFSPREVVGANLQKVLDTRDVFGNRLCSDHCAFHEMVRLGEAPESFELDVRTESGERQRVAVSIVIVLGPNPGQYSLVYLMTPIRRRRRADEAIDRLLAENGAYGLVAVSGAANRNHRHRPKLTDRQLEILERLAAGLHVRDIAAELGISVHTVRSHVRNIFEALEVSSQLEAVAVALRDRMI